MRWMKVWRQCQALDIDGKRCRERSRLHVEKYHGSHDLYDSSETAWVQVVLCEKHRTISGRAPGPERSKT